MIVPYRDRPTIQELGSVQKALDAACTVAPDMSLSFMAFPGNGFAGPGRAILSPSCKAIRR
ncbi:MAG: hypothetical protein PHD39_04915 [Methylobacter tundripaludum]|nr:hypothetical protein [Methylobacter tundripaludum]